MGNTHSKFKEGILKLRSEKKSYEEIREILKCSNSIISYYTSSKQRNNAKKVRINNVSRTKKIRNNSKQRNKDYIKDYLSKHPCIDCGNSDIRVLEFDHVKGIKLANISNASRNAWKLDRLKEEINKCEIRCCNCHRIVTIDRRLIKKINYKNQNEE